ncbi:hypothetical protein FOA52_015697 [Chlamydomonas sp. UWO 241]|nr:hypothetical protein FOA52_015697 [Chlamydomonas sp. UWO 241]
MHHQLALVSSHLALAAEFQRPVSMHCVRAYGQLHDLLRTLPPSAVPPAIMLHSYGGSVECVSQFTRGLPGGIGSRIYFSFSTTIDGRNRDKLLARIAAVPDHRLLVESDQSSSTRIDEALGAIMAAVGEAKGWGAEQVARVTSDNFDAFLGGTKTR